MTIDGNRRPIVCGGQKNRRPDLPILRQTEMFAEESFPDICWAPGIPDPIPFAQAGGRFLFRLIPPDPLGHPIIRLQQPHRPKRRLTPDGRFAVLIPHAHLPVATGPRLQRLPLIRHMSAPVTFDLPAVPQVPLILREDFRRGGDQDLIGRLPLPPDAGLRPHHPTQTRPDDIDPERVLEVFTAQVLDNGACPQLGIRSGDLSSRNLAEKRGGE